MEKYFHSKTAGFEEDVGFTVVYYSMLEDVADMCAVVPTDGGPVAGWPPPHDTVVADPVSHNHYVLTLSQN